MNFQERVEQAKKYITRGNFIAVQDRLDRDDLHVSDYQIYGNMVQIELEDMAVVCGGRKWITVIK